MTFRVGQKVVCINNKPRPGRSWQGDKPELGAVYTICGFVPSLFEDASALLLQEISNCQPQGYARFRFRPVVERKTDISVFLAMLNPSRVTVDAG